MITENGQVLFYASIACMIIAVTIFFMDTLFYRDNNKKIFYWGNFFLHWFFVGVACFFSVSKNVPKELIPVFAILASGIFVLVTKKVYESIYGNNHKTQIIA